MYKLSSFALPDDKYKELKPNDPLFDIIIDKNVGLPKDPKYGAVLRMGCIGPDAPLMKPNQDGFLAALGGAMDSVKGLVSLLLAGQEYMDKIVFICMHSIFDNFEIKNDMSLLEGTNIFGVITDNTYYVKVDGLYTQFWWAVLNNPNLWTHQNYNTYQVAMPGPEGICPAFVKLGCIDAGKYGICLAAMFRGRPQEFVDLNDSAVIKKIIDFHTIGGQGIC